MDSGEAPFWVGVAIGAFFTVGMFWAFNGLAYQVKCGIGVSHFHPYSGEYIADTIERRGDTLIVHRRKE